MDHLKFAKVIENFGLSGEISPNLVTLTSCIFSAKNSLRYALSAVCKNAFSCAVKMYKACIISYLEQIQFC